MNNTIGILMLGLGFVVGISVSVAYAVVADDLICAQCVDKSDMAPNSVGSNKIINQSVKSGDLAPNSVGSKKIINQSVKSGDLAPNSVGSKKIINQSVKSGDLADNSVGSSKIKDHSVKNSDLGNDSVTSDKIKNKSVKKADLDKGAGTTFYKVTENEGGDGFFLVVIAMCDSGDMVVGGGYNVSSGSDLAIRSFPIENPDGWRTDWRTSSNFIGYETTAICQDFRPLH